MGLITVPGTVLTDSAAEAYVVPEDLATSRVNLSFINLDTSPRQVEVWFVPSGESVGDAYKVIGMESAATMLRPGEPRPYPFSQTLLAGDKIFMAADVADKVVAHLDVAEAPADGLEIDGFTRAYVCNSANTGFLPDSLSLAYSVPSENPAAQIVQAELLLHNTDNDPQEFSISAVPPSEGSGDDAWIIYTGSGIWQLAPGEVRVISFEHFLTAGYGVYWSAGTASVIVGRLSVEEIRF